LATFVKLFEPGKIGSLELKNRIIMAAIDSGYTSDEDGHVRESIYPYFIEKARGGMALVTVGVISTLRECPCGKNFPAIWDDSYIPTLRKLTDAIHSHDARVSAQLAHHGVFLAHPTRLAQIPSDVLDLMGPSEINFAGSPARARAMSREDIRHVVEDGFGQAARRAKEAGFDAVEIHGGTVALLNQFRSPYFNRRRDEYGGDAGNRARLTCEVIREIRRTVGPDMPVILKMNGEEQFPGGLTLDDTLVQAPLFAEAGADAIVVTAGMLFMSPGGFGGMNYMEPMGDLLPLAAAVKGVVKVPVAAIGRIDAAVGEAALRQGKADFVAMGRPIIADPHLPDKTKDGRMADVWRCIYCNACLMPADPAFRDELRRTPLVCTMNPSIGNEDEFVIRRAGPSKRVMVIGGGIAGMEAAHLLAGRGHRVSLHEKADVLGGQWNVAARLKGRKPYASLTNRLRRAVTQSKVELVMGEEVTVEMVRRVGPDSAVVATGAVSAPLDVPGGGRSSVVKAEDELARRGRVGHDVVVLGGLNPAMEVAYSIASRCKRLSVVLVPELGRKIDMTTHYSLRTRLTELGAFLYPNAALLEILDDGVWIRYSFGLQYPEPLFLKADVVVQATVGVPENRLVTELTGVVPELYAIGDCVEARNAVTAMREAAEIGYRL